MNEPVENITPLGSLVEAQYGQTVNSCLVSDLPLKCCRSLANGTPLRALVGSLRRFSDDTLVWLGDEKAKLGRDGRKGSRNGGSFLYWL